MKSKNPSVIKKKIRYLDLNSNDKVIINKGI